MWGCGFTEQDRPPDGRSERDSLQIKKEMYRRRRDLSEGREDDRDRGDD